MNLSKLNLDSVKMKNRQAILTLINNQGAMSRKDIAESVKLTSASVTQLCGEMIEEGIIYEQGAIVESGKVGRKKILVGINYDCKKVCSVVLGKYVTDITLTNLRGNVIETKSIQTDSEIEPAIFLAQIVDICKKLLKNNNSTYEDLLGIGVSTRGIVDSTNGISNQAYDIWDEEVDIRGIMQQEIPVNIVVENNMKAYAQGEIIYGFGKQYKQMVFVKWFPGVGAAIVIDGEIYHGTGNKVAEMGHYIINPAGERCKCGRIGCLETMVSLKAIINSILRIYTPTSTPILYKATGGDSSQIRMYIERYLADDSLEIDEYVMEIFTKASERIARTVVNVITILAPDKVVTYGKFMEKQYLHDSFLQYCSSYDPAYDASYILQSKVSDKDYYIGGLAVVVKELFFNTGGYIVG